jgi:RNA-binding protein YhbY
MIITIIIYTVIGIYRTRELELEQNNTQSGDAINSGEDINISQDEQNRISYEIVSGDDEIILTGISEGIISVTTYKFEQNKLVKITLSEEITSGDEKLVENIYDHMKTDEDMLMVYSNIEKNGKVITATLKDEYVASYGEAGKKEIYDELINSLEISQ